MEFSRELIERCRRAKSVVVLTGAGISAESGVPTFRGEDGLWRKYMAEELATPYAFARDPRLVWEWYDWRRQIISKCLPNPGHYAIAKLETVYPDFLLITQNVDGLHVKAGSKNLREIHGNIWRVRCTGEERVSENIEVPLKDIPPMCECGKMLRPHIVWFGESLDSEDIKISYEAIEKCELFFSVGTSALVQPAASFAMIAKENSACVVEINRDPTPISDLVDYSVMGRAGEILPELVEKLNKILNSNI
ncbi:MAG: NAD-dependent deacylase [Candidatus Schekmanbacteria bacterium RIFCSPHIGHO2_02_FULL_38_11]|uniref:NAD-dependent protein deacylase n=1 Tax=Candidatus Schekmanbacteria bacterium RIFCSPLOWO2_12_FULL_38_15 TaxID=1817883 RepID=A0A1F7SFE2_9BACT|nr:MAG: NAD-dependent deacylase [Candidatus Schekmanbacteria bacterium RIFCSPHIGHO2_02_FULL_38_11]OGL50615.1 MAG: NAD-dependent deacylase [Candidatus Schekmanbacteria bacterium RIFCSPLOWO2_02_FULL_38_14]OGL52479.1 MAG: NAD-dependent deacylase [Candidatus Schekmanbacteria bacterium RIFCSPLOWO2_12_FULL_38_15]